MRKLKTDADLWIEALDKIFAKHGYKEKGTILSDKYNQHFVTIKFLWIPVEDEENQNNTK